MEVKKKENLVCKFRKSLYELKLLRLSFIKDDMM